MRTHYGHKPKEKRPEKEYRPYTMDDLYEENAKVDDDDPFGDFKTDAQLIEDALQKSIQLDTALEAEYGNKFPIDVFPKEIADFILNADAAMNYPQDYVATGVLCALSGAMRNNYRIMFKENFV